MISAKVSDNTSDV